MADQALLLLLGFLLTTVLGGLLGYVFQRRAWTHQFDMAQVSSERENAIVALHEMCGVLDKRRYRMLLVFWYADNPNEEEFERRLDAYRSVLEEWNDGLNRRLALVATHFGADLRQELDRLYESYRQAGILLDELVRDRRAGTNNCDRRTLIDLLEQLNLRNYQFAEAGLSLIIDGRIGSRMTKHQRLETTPPPRDVVTRDPTAS